jgi:hypothetical protein
MYRFGCRGRNINIFLFLISKWNSIALYHKTMNKKVNETLIFHRSPQKVKLRVRAYFKFLNMFHGIKEIFATIVLEAFWNH